MGLLDDILAMGQNGGTGQAGLLYQPSPDDSGLTNLQKQLMQLTKAGAFQNGAPAVGFAAPGSNNPDPQQMVSQPQPPQPMALPQSVTFPSPLSGADPQQTAATDAAALGSFGVNPASLPQRTPFDVPQQALPQTAMPSPAPSPFGGGGATPFGFAGPGSMTGISPAMMQGPQPGAAPAQVAPALAAAAPAAPGPAAPAAPGAAPAVAADDASDPIEVGNYQMPRIGDGFPDDATPANATPTSAAPGAAPAAAAPGGPAPFSLGGAGSAIGDRLMKATKGFAGNLASGPIGAVAGGLGALITGQSTDPGSITAERANASAQALLSKGASLPDVIAAKDNPELMKALIAQYYGKDKWKVVKTGQDAFGGETYMQHNEEDGTFKPIGAPDASSGGSMMAPGVKTVDSTLTGDAYLKQFSPEVQAAVLDYKDGKATPTGNARKGFTQVVKMVAQKYGADTGQQIDDTTYSARRTMRNGLSSSAPASLGGQINIGNTAAGHLADLSQKALELGNYDTGIAPLSAAVNGVRGLGTEQAAKMEALQGAAQHYGQEITKFYAGSPGGNAERDRFITSVNGAKSPKELAAILETEGQLMHSRLDALGGQIQGVLGDDGMKQYPVLRPDGQAGLDKVTANVARLRGGPAPMAPAAPAASSGSLQPGQSTMIGNISIKRVN